MNSALLSNVREHLRQVRSAPLSGNSVVWQMGQARVRPPLDAAGCEASGASFSGTGSGMTSMISSEAARRLICLERWREVWNRWHMAWFGAGVVRARALLEATALAAGETAWGRTAKLIATTALTRAYLSAWSTCSWLSLARREGSQNSHCSPACCGERFLERHKATTVEIAQLDWPHRSSRRI